MRATLLVIALSAAAAMTTPAARASTGVSRIPWSDVSAIGATPGVSVINGAMVFGPRAAKRYKRVAGRQVAVTCTAVPRSPRILAEIEDGFLAFIAPTRRSEFSAGVEGGDVCDLRVAPRKAKTLRIDERPPVASVALTEWGTTILDRRPTALRVSRVEDAALFYDQRFPTAAELLKGTRSVVVAMPAADATPPPFPAIGLWADGQGHVSVRAFTRAGYLLHTLIADDSRTENIRFWLDTIQ